MVNSLVKEVRLKHSCGKFIATHHDLLLTVTGVTDGFTVSELLISYKHDCIGGEGGTGDHLVQKTK